MGEHTTEMSFTDVISNMYTSVDKFWELPSGAHHKYVSRWLSPRLLEKLDFSDIGETQTADFVTRVGGIWGMGGEKVG